MTTRSSWAYAELERTAFRRTRSTPSFQTTQFDNPSKFILNTFTHVVALMYRKLLCFRPGKGIFFVCECSRLGAKLKYPGGIFFFFFRTSPGVFYPGGVAKIPTTCTHSIHTHKRWTRSTHKRSERRGREGRIKRHMHGAASPQWCWILRHQKEEGPGSQRVPGTAVQAAPNHWSKWALLVR